MNANKIHKLRATECRLNGMKFRRTTILVLHNGRVTVLGAVSYYLRYGGSGWVYCYQIRCGYVDIFTVSYLL